MYRDVISVPEDMDQEEVARLFDKYGFLVLPVVDKQAHLVGVITLDDVLDVAEEEATEDIHKTASIIPMKEAYIDASVWTLFKKRILWLLSLIMINVISSQIMASYEQVLSTALALAFFIPMLIGTGGNAGSQSAALVVRALVTGDIKLVDWRRILCKEVLVGGGLGMALGLASTLLGVWRGGPAIGLVVGFTMVAVVLLSNIIGMLLPFILTKLRLDPTVASSPLITSICDAAGLLIYFAIAALVIQI
jgi:magnesium transporter